MSLPEIVNRGPQLSRRIPGAVSSYLRFIYMMIGVTVAFFVMLTPVWSVGNARASQPWFQKAESAGVTPTPTCTQARNFQVTVSANATMVPADNYVQGSSCSNCVVSVDLPFPYPFYDYSPRTFVNLSSEGNLQFLLSNASGNNRCLPQGTLIGAIMPYWDDLDTSIDDTMGYYTSVVGIAPDRIFAIRYHGGKVASDSIVDYEVLLYEGQPRFDIIYGAVHERGFSATIGVQAITGGDGRWTEFSCNTQSINQGTRLVFDRRVCKLDSATLR